MNVIWIAIMALAVPLGAALILILTDAPHAVPDRSNSLDFSSVLVGSGPRAPAPELIVVRDGSTMPTRIYGQEGAARWIVVLLHGSGWHGLQWHNLAEGLAVQPGTLVLAPDLRGHGAEPDVRGDVAYIGQLEDDVADLIAHFKRGSPGAKVLLVGHSSGGGLAIRFGGGAHSQQIDRYVLLAPYLGHNAPTTKPNSGGWAFPAVRRIIGLSILNTLQISALNGLPVIAFAMPQSVLAGPLGHTATTEYSYRMNVSYAPRDYAKDLQAINRPVLFVVGGSDEAFLADRYEAVARKHLRDARTVIVPGAGHLSLVDDPRTLEAIRAILD